MNELVNSFKVRMGHKPGTSPEKPPKETDKPDTRPSPTQGGR